MIEAWHNDGMALCVNTKIVCQLNLICTPHPHLFIWFLKIPIFFSQFGVVRGTWHLRDSRIEYKQEGQGISSKYSSKYYNPQ